LVEEDDAPDVRGSIARTTLEARDALRLTQAEVADALGMAREVYGRIERGQLMPSVSTLIAIAKVLHVTPNQLLGWSASEPKGRILELLEQADDSSLSKAEAVLTTLLLPERKK
jgi:transcriptional regulator with XRE-family HTH domain